MHYTCSIHHADCVKSRPLEVNERIQIEALTALFNIELYHNCLITLIFNNNIVNYIYII